MYCTNDYDTTVGSTATIVTITITTAACTSLVNEHLSWGRHAAKESAKRRQPDYVALLPEPWREFRGEPQLVGGRSVHAPLARGRLKRWKSLKEKRLAWS